MLNILVVFQSTSYDVELQALHEMIQQKVVILLSDPDNIVKRTLLESGITRLCVFFGRQKGEKLFLLFLKLGKVQKGKNGLASGRRDLPKEVQFPQCGRRPSNPA